MREGASSSPYSAERQWPGRSRHARSSPPRRRSGFSTASPRFAKGTARLRRVDFELVVEASLSPLSPILLGFAFHSRRIWVLALDPVRRAAGPVARVLPLRHDAFEPHLAGVRETSGPSSLSRCSLKRSPGAARRSSAASRATPTICPSAGPCCCKARTRCRRAARRLCSQSKMLSLRLRRGPDSRCFAVANVL